MFTKFSASADTYMLVPVLKFGEFRSRVPELLWFKFENVPLPQIFKRPSSGEAMRRMPKRFRAAKRARGSLSACQVRCGWDFARRLGTKNFEFLPRDAMLARYMLRLSV